jgi:hypothetical protein
MLHRWFFIQVAMNAQGLLYIGLGSGEGGFGYKILSPAGIFTAELTALFVTL